MSSRVVALALTAWVGAMVGCSHEPSTPNAQQPIGEVHTTSAETTTTSPAPTPAPPPPKPEATRPKEETTAATAAGEPTESLDITAPTRITCWMRDQPADAPHFEPNGVTLSAHGEDALHQLGVCLTTGPLAGKKVCLTGYADATGSKQYNDGLGLARGYAAMHYLERFGVEPNQTEVTSRGESGAHSTDEAVRALQRRVEITLADDPDSPCRQEPQQPKKKR